MSAASASDDTAPEVRARLVRGWRAMPSARKAALVDAWSADVRALALAGIRCRHPDADAEEIRLRLGCLLLGEATARAALEARRAGGP